TFARPLDAVRVQRGLSSLPDFREHYCAGDWCAYLDLPQLVDLPWIPAGHFYLGPLAWAPAGGAAPALGSLPKNQPLAYVTMGSSGDGGALQEILGGLLDAGCCVAVSGV